MLQKNLYIFQCNNNKPRAHLSPCLTCTKAHWNTWEIKIKATEAKLPISHSRQKNLSRETIQRRDERGNEQMRMHADQWESGTNSEATTTTNSFNRNSIHLPLLPGYLPESFAASACMRLRAAHVCHTALHSCTEENEARTTSYLNVCLCTSVCVCLQSSRVRPGLD